MHLFVEFRHFQSAATCYGMRQLSVYSLRVEDWIMLWFGCLFLCRVSGHLAGGCLGSWRAPPLFVCFCCCFSSMIQIKFIRLHRGSQLVMGRCVLLLLMDVLCCLSLFSPGCLTFHSAQRASPQFENYVQIFHLSSTDDERTGPGYMNQLACEQKKFIFM